MKEQPVVLPTPWYLAPLYSRGKFSPRLLMAWQAFYAACYLCWRFVTTPSTVLNGVLVQPAGVGELVGLLLGLVSVLLGLGTLQKIQLGEGPPPESLAAPTADEKAATE